VKVYAIHVGHPSCPAILATDCPNKAADIVDLLSMPAYMVNSQTGRIVYRNKKAREQDNANRDGNGRARAGAPKQDPV